MTRIYNFLLPLFLLLLISSCGTYDYLINRDEVIRQQEKNMRFHVYGNSPQPNLFAKKGQIKLDGTLGIASAASVSAAVTGSMAVSIRHVGASGYHNSNMTVEGMFRNSGSDETYIKNINVTLNTDVRSTITDAGLFYYNANHRFLRYEAGGGFAFGRIINEYGISTYNILIDSYDSRRFTQYYLQGALGIILRRLETALHVRASSYHFFDREFESSEELDFPFENNGSCLESGFRAGLRFWKLSFYYQFNTGMPLQNKSIKWHLKDHTAGIALRLGENHKRRPLEILP